jgi:UDP-N-acetyl-D-mannosaminuronic acid dehydrogenase
MKKNKIVVVGGCGHIGLPLAVSLANAGFEVVAYDKNNDSINIAKTGKMPFFEKDGDLQLSIAIQSDNLKFQSVLDERSFGSDFIITIGTPVDEFLNPSLKIFESCIDELLPFINNDSLLILRSTVFPGTTDWLNRYVRSKNIEPLIAFCLERVVQGLALQEIQELPQIVAGTSKEAEQRASDIFLRLTDKVVTCTPKQAEFSKLFSNAFRYIQFAIANQFYILAEDAGEDFHKIREVMLEGYPRAEGLPSPGFSAGPCLFKDTMQLVSFAQNNFGLGFHAMLVNEGLVLHVKSKIERLPNASSLNIGLLGMSFKANCDDPRSSLSYKLKKVLRPIVKEVYCTDDLVTEDKDLLSLDEVLEKSDLIVLCTPHDIYKDLKFKKPVIDIWNFYKNS